MHFSILIKFLVLGCLFILGSVSYAEIIGNPPYQTIQIPTSASAYYFDMEQDHEKTLYIAYVNGVKIFDGARWQNVYVGEDSAIRRLYFNQDNRVYFGGSGIIGYVYKDASGQYQFKDITPSNPHFDDIWHISECNDSIVFISLHSVFLYNQKTEAMKNWDFDAKLGDGFCHNQTLTIQDRKRGLLELQKDKWVKSSINLSHHNPVEKFQQINDDTYFILAQNKDWQIIQNNEIKQLRFDKQLPNLDNYVASASLGDGKLVLGSNNGLLTFIDVNSAVAQSFQLTNEWISKIIRTDNELIVLTEFEIYYMQWPSAIRLQGKDSGLASSLMDIEQWNNNTFVAGSAGVFLEDKQQLVYQHKLFKRLNWTNKEAWLLLPLNDKQVLLAESHRLFLIEGDVMQPKITAISDVIYPRELIKSRYNPNLIYVITEFDTQMLFMENGSWQFKPLHSQRVNSIIENGKNSILITANDGFYHIIADMQNGKVVKQQPVNSSYQMDKTTSEDVALILGKDKKLYGYASQSIFELNEGQQPKPLFSGLFSKLKGDDIAKLTQAEDGLFYGFTAFKLFFQDAMMQWHIVDMSPYIRGVIDNIKIINNHIKVLSNGVLITYLKDNGVETKTSDYALRMTQIVLKHNNEEKYLPTDAKSIIKFDQGDGALTFSCVLNDVKNHNNITYRFKLSGETDGWSDFTHNSKIHISNITAGNYTLDIQAKDSNAKIYSMPSYHFIVNPAWYLSQMAQLMWLIGALMAVAIIIHLIIKWREKLHESQKQELKSIINEKTHALKKANSHLQKMAHLDGLTGLSNRFYLDEFIHNLTQMPIKNITVMMMDMDDFKLYNDKNGHIAGDELLKKMAQYLLQIIDRPSDMSARYGGEEFLVLMLDCELYYAQAMAESIRQYIEDKDNKTSVSIGVCYSNNYNDLNNLDAIYHLIDCADQAMYEAKQKGKNQIIVYD